MNLKVIKRDFEGLIGYKHYGEYTGPIRVINGEFSYKFELDMYKQAFPKIQQEDIVIIKKAGIV